MVEAPAAEVIFQINQLFGKLVEAPVFRRVFIDCEPCRLDGCVSLMRGAQAEDLGSEACTCFSFQCTQSDVIERRARELVFKELVQFGAVSMYLHHVFIAVAKHVFDEAVLVLLKA